MADEFGLDAAAVTSSTRGAPRAAYARQVAMYLAHVGFALSFETIGRALDRDRTTVAHACRVVEDSRDDARLDRWSSHPASGVRLALQACGPEFSGLLMDVCCFLRGLEDVEHERGWPPRSAKDVLQLALDKLARHYGLASGARSEASAHVRTWLASDATFTSE